MKSRLLLFSSLVICGVLILSSCGSSDSEIKGLLNQACFKVRTAVDLNWNYAMEVRRTELLLEASSIFKEVGISKPEYLKYAEITGMYSRGLGIPTVDRDDLLGFCASS